MIGTKVSRRSILKGCVGLAALGFAGLGTARGQAKKPTITVYKEPT